MLWLVSQHLRDVSCEELRAFGRELAKGKALLVPTFGSVLDKFQVQSASTFGVSLAGWLLEFR